MQAPGAGSEAGSPDGRGRVDWEMLGIALGLVLILEGLPYFLHPEGMQAFLRQMQGAEPRTLRILGFLAMLSGVTLLVIVRWGP